MFEGAIFSHHRTQYLVLFERALLFQKSFSLAKQLFNVISLCLWRYVIRFEYQKGDWKYLVGMSLAEPCLYFLFEGHAMEYTSASQAGVIVSCLPIIVALMAFFMLKEYISKAIVIGFTLCIGGSISNCRKHPEDCLLCQFIP